MSSPHSLDDNSTLPDALHDIAATAIEFADSLDLLSLVDLIDLYHWHIVAENSRTAKPEILPFSAFVNNQSALSAAARTATDESGVQTMAPPRLSPATRQESTRCIET